MSLLNRISKGFIFEDDFSTPELNPMWQVSPSSTARYSLTEKAGSLRIKHGDPDIFVLLNAPNYDFVIELDANYFPVQQGDEGGIVAFRDIHTYIELLSYYDSEKGISVSYSRLRMVRTSDLYEGYGSMDNGASWDLIGTSFISAPKIGISLHGGKEAAYDTLDAEKVRMYRNTSIQIGNLSSGQRIELVKPDGTVIGNEYCKPDKDHVDIDCSRMNFPLNAIVKVYDQAGFMLDETEELDDVWGGDVFWYGVRLDFELDGLLMRQDREYQLGNMENGIIERRGYIINNNDIPVYNVKASVQALSEYYGWEWVDVANDSLSQPGSYGNSVNIGTIMPGRRIPLWIKIIRQPHQQLASLHDYKFRIMFESG